jgi:hypothetical protein
MGGFSRPLSGMFLGILKKKLVEMFPKMDPKKKQRKVVKNVIIFFLFIR